MQNINDVVLCSDSSEVRHADGDKLSEGCGVHRFYCK